MKLTLVSVPSAFDVVRVSSSGEGKVEGYLRRLPFPERMRYRRQSRPDQTQPRHQHQSRYLFHCYHSSRSFQEGYSTETTETIQEGMEIPSEKRLLPRCDCGDDEGYSNETANATAGRGQPTCKLRIANTVARGQKSETRNKSVNQTTLRISHQPSFHRW